jgi:uncharacterized DUF497 family protein
VGFEWDAGKAGTNLRKHKVDFADAATAVEEEALDHAWYEWAAVVRLISARPATARERRQYEAQK